MKHGAGLAQVAYDLDLCVMTRKPELIAHRGANREAPENSLRAFVMAIDAGADGMELDIQLTADGVPVVNHDAALPRSPSGGRGERISTLTLARLQQRAEMATLDDVLALVHGRTRLYVEIKAPAAVDAVVSRLAGREAWCAVHSFDHRVSLRVRELNPVLETGILVVGRLVDPVAALLAARARDYWQHSDFVDRALVRDVQAAGGRLIAWTVNDPTVCGVFNAMGVDGICTDATRELAPVMKRTQAEE